MSSETTFTLESSDGDLAPLLRALARAPHIAKPPDVGELVDARYELVRVLGRGGMGVVFEARDARTRRAVALKWMTRVAGCEREYEASLARFVREARIAAKISHPNVVSVFDVNADHAPPYLVMELLRGHTLRSWMKDGPLAWERALDVLLPAMRGVAALHRAGVVHRDLKPDNIFLCEGDGEIPATTKILDFGVSLMATNDAEGVTRTGATLGTPAYMPIEQLRAARDVGPAADVYALGIVLYEALSGQRPFASRSAADHAIALATERPRPLAELVPSLAGARANAVMRAIERDARARFASVDALVDALVRAEPRRASRAPWAALVLVAAALAAWAIASHAPERPAPLAGRAADATRVTGSPEKPMLLAETATPPPVAAPESPPRARGGRRRVPRATDVPPASDAVPAAETDLERAVRLDPRDFR